MTDCKFSVKVYITEKTKGSLEEIVYGDGSFPVSTFDKIKAEAQKNKGDFYSGDMISCDYCFDSKEDAEKFIKSIKRKFKNKIEIQCGEEPAKENQSKFKILPDNTEQRIAALTPKTINNKKIGIHLIDDSSLLLPEEEKHLEVFRLTYANIRCKITGKINSKPIILRSSQKVAEQALKLSKNISFKSAKSAGWKDSDIFYDMVVNSILKKDVFEEKYNNKDFPEIGYVSTDLKIVIANYFEQQFVGWFFYNENLDEPINYTNYIA